MPPKPCLPFTGGCFYLGITSSLYIVLCNPRVKRFGCFGFQSLFSRLDFFVTFGIFIMLHCRRSWEELPTSQAALKTSHAYKQLQPLSQLICEYGNMDTKQSGGLAAAQIPASKPPHKPFPPHLGSGNGFHRCTAIFQLSLNHLLIAI